MEENDLYVVSFVGAIVVLLLLTFIEGHVLLLHRALRWERVGHSVALPPAGEWLRARLPEFAVADLSIRALVTAVMVGSCVVLLGRLTPPQQEQSLALVAALPVLLAFGMEAAGYLLLGIVAAAPSGLALRAAQLLTLLSLSVVELIVRLARRSDAAASPRNEDDGEADRRMDDWAGDADWSGRLDAPENEMVRGVRRLSDKAAREVMTPRLDMVALAIDTPFEDVVKTAIATGFSRIPLYEGTLDHIVGIVYTKDLLTIRYQGQSGSTDELRDLARQPEFIPETKKIRDLLQQFRQSRVHMAIVIDEYGGTAGLVTIEDLLEEIVGEIEDEYDHHQQEAQIVRLSESVSLVDARLSIDDFNRLLHLDLDASDYHTVGGFVSTHLGKIPSVGDRVPVNGMMVVVESVRGRSIKRVRVIRTGFSETAHVPVGGLNHPPDRNERQR